jgi:hypothetical protein
MRSPAAPPENFLTHLPRSQAGTGQARMGIWSKNPPLNAEFNHHGGERI